MASFAITTGKHYLVSHSVFRAKSGQIMKTVEILQDHIPPIVQRMLSEGRQFNILSVGSGEGMMDMAILKIIKKLKKSEHGPHMKIFNRAIEPNEYSCDVYEASIENLPLDDQ